MTEISIHDQGEETRPSQREAAILSLVPTARRIAQHRARMWGLPPDDAVGDAMVGVVQAVDRYDPDRGSDLLAFAHRRIVGAIIDGARERSWRPARGGADVPDRPVVPLEAVPRNGEAPVSTEPECPSAQAALSHVEDVMVTQQLMAKLNRRHAWVVREYFLRSRPLKDIARELQVSESRVSQILSAAKRTMRAAATAAAAPQWEPRVA